MGRGSPKNSEKAYGNAKLRKGPRKPKESKRARQAQGKTNGTQEPANDVKKEQWSYWAIGRKINGRPKEAEQDRGKQLCSKNDRVIWQEMVARKRVG